MPVASEGGSEISTKSQAVPQESSEDGNEVSTDSTVSPEVSSTEVGYTPVQSQGVPEQESIDSPNSQPNGVVTTVTSQTTETTVVPFPTSEGNNVPSQSSSVPEQGNIIPSVSTASTGGNGSGSASGQQPTGGSHSGDESASDTTSENVTQTNGVPAGTVSQPSGAVSGSESVSGSVSSSDSDSVSGSGSGSSKSDGVAASTSTSTVSTGHGGQQTYNSIPASDFVSKTVGDDAPISTSVSTETTNVANPPIPSTMVTSTSNGSGIPQVSVSIPLVSSVSIPQASASESNPLTVPTYEGSASFTQISSFMVIIFTLLSVIV